MIVSSRVMLQNPDPVSSSAPSKSTVFVIGDDGDLHEIITLVAAGIQTTSSRQCLDF